MTPNHEDVRATGGVSRTDGALVLPEWARSLNASGPVVLDIKLGDLDAAAADLEAYRRSGQSLSGLVYRLDLTETDVAGVQREELAEHGRRRAAPQPDRAGRRAPGPRGPVPRLAGRGHAEVRAAPGRGTPARPCGRTRTRTRRGRTTSSTSRRSTGSTRPGTSSPSSTSPPSRPPSGPCRTKRAAIRARASSARSREGPRAPAGSRPSPSRSCPPPAPTATASPCRGAWPRRPGPR